MRHYVYAEREERRKRVATELLDTERSYMTSLRQLQEQWLPAIKTFLKKEKDDLNNLFNSVDLIVQFNTTLLGDLAVVIENWEPERRVGEVFVKLVRSLSFVPNPFPFSSSLKSLEFC